jgi:predicted MFS family arabinose efflux permease
MRLAHPILADTHHVGTVEDIRETAAGLSPDRRLAAVLCLAIFLAALNVFAATPFYPQMAHDLQTTVPLLGQILTLLTVLSAGLGLVVGPLADHSGYRRPLVLGVLAIGLALLGTGLAPTYPVLLGLSGLMGLGDALVYGLAFALAASHFHGAAQRRVMSWMVASISLAPIVGVPLLGVLGGFTTWRVALMFGGLVALLSAWVMAVTLPPDTRQHRAPVRWPTLLQAYAPIVRHPASLRWFAVSALRAMWWYGLVTYLGAFLAMTFGLPPAAIGLVYPLVGGAYAVGSLAAGGRLGARSPRITIGTASLAGGLLMGLMLHAHELRLVLVLLPLLALAAAFWSVGAVAHLATESPLAAGTTMVLNSSLLNLGAAAGASLGGLLITLGGYGSLGIGIPVVAMVAAVLAWWPGGSGEAFADGPGGGFGAGADAELAEDIGHVGAGRRPADEQRLGNLRIGATGDQQAQHLTLSWGEADAPGQVARVIPRGRSRRGGSARNLLKHRLA